MLLIIYLWVVTVVLTMLFPEGSMILNYVSVVLFAFTIFRVLKKSDDFGVIAISLMISYLMTAAICSFAETGVWFSEAKLQSHTTGATARNAFLCAVIVVTAQWVFKAAGRFNFANATLGFSVNKYLLNMVTILSITCSLILVAINIKYGHPNDYGTDRFYYWENVAPKWAQYINFLSTQLAIFLGMAYAIRQRRMYIYLFIFSLLAQYLVGEKATGMYSSFIMFIIPVFILKGIYMGDVILKPKVLLIGASLVAVIIVAVLLSYAAMGGRGEASEMLMNRVVLQSQMWWTVDQRASGGMQSIDSILTNMLGFGADKFETGIFYLMGSVSSSKTYLWFVDNGVNWTMASPVNLIYFFGFPLAAVPAAIVGAIFGFMAQVLYKAIICRDIILVFLAVKLYNAAWQVMTMGNGYSLFSPQVALAVLGIIIYSIALKKKPVYI